MLQTAIDDSGWDGVSPVFVLAGYVSTKEKWKSFSDEWQAILDLKEPSKLGHLKMNEAYRLNDPSSQFCGWSEAERDDRLKKLIKPITRHALHGLISVVPIEPYRRLFRGRFDPAALNRPYFFTFFGVMARLINLARQLQLGDEIEFIFDTLGGELQALLLDEFEKFISLRPPTLQHLTCSPPKFAREQDFAPLQAADMLAWHARRYYFDQCRGKEPTSEPSNVYFAHLFDPKHDVIDVWTEEKLTEVAEFLSVRKWLRGLRGTSMPLPDFIK